MTNERAEISDNSDYPYLMPWDRRPAAVRAFVARRQYEPTTAADMAWIEGYISCIEDLPR
jgi:hypothetical protein